jgi:hypothetical protein
MQKSRHSGAQSVNSSFVGPHVAVIMDGNGRWATAHGLKRSAGHEAGLRTARQIVEAAVREGVGTMTLYAFSSDNWKRPTPDYQYSSIASRQRLNGVNMRAYSPRLWNILLQSCHCLSCILTSHQGHAIP